MRALVFFLAMAGVVWILGRALFRFQTCPPPKIVHRPRGKTFIEEQQELQSVLGIFGNMFYSVSPFFDGKAHSSYIGRGRQPTDLILGGLGKNPRPHEDNKADDIHNTEFG